MELDSFTENLIQRTQARRDYLSKKLSEINQLSARKRRTSDTDENNSIAETADSKQVDDSPKRKCLETSSEVESNTEYVDEEVENKENLQTKNEQSNVFVPIHTPGKTRGLAALRKSNLLDSKDNAICRSPKDGITIGCDVPSSVVLTSRNQPSINSRFASLAAVIRNWDDNSSNSSSSSLSVPVTATSDTKEYTSVSSDAGSAKLDSYSNVKHVTFDVEDSSDDGSGLLLDSQSTSNTHNRSKCSYSPKQLPERSLKCNKEEQLVHKDHVWDQAVLATLESQGFVKSSSNSKLSYDFSVKSKQNDTEVNLPLSQNSQGKKADELIRCQQISDTCEIKSSVNKPVAITSLGMESREKKISGQAAVCANKTTVGDGGKDPAELPLSSRRALFESAFLGGSQKQIKNTCESSLSVAQRAAIFERVAKQGIMPSPNKITQRDPVSPGAVSTGFLSPTKAAVAKPTFSTELKLTENSMKPGSSSEANASPLKFQDLASPLKNTEPHTLLQPQHFSSHPDWKGEITVAKAERKNTISALCSHWEKVSSSSADSNPESMVIDNPDKRNSNSNLTSYDEKKSEVFLADESSSFEEIPDDDSFGLNQSISSELESDEKMASDTDDSNEFDECSDLTGEAVAICNEMDELLSEELDSKTKNSVPMSAIEKVQENCTGPDTSSSNQSSWEKLASSPKSLSSVPVCSTEGSTKASVLQYTVSTYRRQKQEAKTTPLRTIKREPSINPPSPKADEIINIKEEIQVLHNEVLTQQNHISQTSQALNLCSATAEFSGSVEEVEGERLLLIATLKRQACLNEIQRLRSLHQEMAEDRKGTLTINDIKLPLKKDFIALQLEGKTEMVHYFMCSIRHHGQVVFTQMLSTKDGVSGGCLNFTNHISIHDLPADFSVALEVYSLQRKKEVLPHEKKYHIKKDHSKLRLTPKGKRGDSKLLVPAVSSPGGPCAVRTPSFIIVGYTRFTIKNCDRKCCTLEKVPFTSPLDGTLHFNVQLHAEHNISLTGFLTMFEDVSGFGAWHRRWCVLDGGDLAFWKYPDEEKKKDPIGIIDLTQCVTAEVGLVSRDICARPHTFQLVTMRPHEKGDKNTLISRSVNTLTTTKHLLSADTKPERIVWCQKLNDALTVIRKWNPHALKPMEINKDSK